MKAIFDKPVTEIFEKHRGLHGVLDSIRFTARDLGCAPIEVAWALGLVDYFLRARS